jgi:hypothetical protein
VINELNEERRLQNDERKRLQNDIDVQERKVQDVEFRAEEIEKDYEDAKRVRDEF